MMPKGEKMLILPLCLLRFINVVIFHALWIIWIFFDSMIVSASILHAALSIFIDANGGEIMCLDVYLEEDPFC